MGILAPMLCRSLPASLALTSLLVPLCAQSDSRLHGKRPKSAVIENVHVIRGDGAPAYGPTSVYIADGRIVAEPIEAPEARVDGTGCYLLPGLVNTHAHIHAMQADIPIEKEYIFGLWLASGITTVRDNGSAYARTARLRAQSEKGEIAAPRILIYRGFGKVANVEEATKRVISFRESGADGIKLWSDLSYPPEILEAVLLTAKNQQLRTTAHIGVGESDAVTYAQHGLNSIEHWYGIPDAALDGVQAFPPEFSYSDEVQRFRQAGRLWREADPKRLDDVLAYLVEEGVSWSPTLAIYEASRDLVRAQNKPWFRDLLHPALERFFTPGLGFHGSYFLDWTSTDEANWKENYRIWMDALRRFGSMGGNIVTGEDAGYIYVMYGFGLVRELELHQEAGFKPLQVLRHATYNAAKMLGREGEFGRVLPGLSADLALVEGNPLRDLKVLYPGGGERIVDGKPTRVGGVRLTVKQGWFYHGPTLLKEARELVAKARDKAKR